MLFDLFRGKAPEMNLAEINARLPVLQAELEEAQRELEQAESAESDENARRLFQGQPVVAAKAVAALREKIAKHRQALVGLHAVRVELEKARRDDLEEAALAHWQAWAAEHRRLSVLRQALVAAAESIRFPEQPATRELKASGYMLSLDSHQDAAQVGPLAAKLLTLALDAASDVSCPQKRPVTSAAAMEVGRRKEEDRVIASRQRMESELAQVSRLLDGLENNLRDESAYADVCWLLDHLGSKSVKGGGRYDIRSLAHRLKDVRETRTNMGILSKVSNIPSDRARAIAGLPA